MSSSVDATGGRRWIAFQYTTRSPDARFELSALKLCGCSADTRREERLACSVGDRSRSSRCSLKLGAGVW
jgi:hypothetical protein